MSEDLPIDDGINQPSNEESIDHFDSGVIRKTEYFDVFISYKRDNEEEFNEHALKSLKATGKMIVRNGGKWIEGLNDTAKYLFP